MFGIFPYYFAIGLNSPIHFADSNHFCVVFNFQFSIFSAKMDINWNDNLNQILELHEHGIECELNKSVTAFNSLNAPLDRSMMSCFLGILKNR